MKKLFVIISLLLLPAWALQAQTLAFNVDASADLTVTVMNDPLNFGNNLMENQGQVSIIRDDPNAVLISITGDQRCTVDVSIIPPPALTINGSNDELPFTLKAAYANEGQEDPTQATEFTTSNNSTASTTFRIKKRTNSNKPIWAGPKCRDGSPGNNQNKISTAYVYIYGNITVGNVRAGTYDGNINVNIQYADQ